MVLGEQGRSPGSLDKLASVSGLHRTLEADQHEVEREDREDQETKRGREESRGAGGLQKQAEGDE